jgi:hypothetical protein
MGVPADQSLFELRTVIVYEPAGTSAGIVKVMLVPLLEVIPLTPEAYAGSLLDAFTSMISLPVELKPLPYAVTEEPETVELGTRDILGADDISVAGGYPLPSKSL